MLSRLDAWTNLLRLTAAGFAGAVGGADALVLEPFTQPLGPATDFARRQARNTQLVLMEEAHLGRVADPARGAWFVERFTEDLARAGWAFFQQIESAGGLAEALRSGLVSRAVADARAAREAELASGTLALVGVTRFPDSRPTDIAVDPVDPSAFARPAPDLRLPGPDDACPPLKPMRLAEPYEHASDRSGADGR
jgi:methylmalonyl-CoA mutase